MYDITKLTFDSFIVGAENRAAFELMQLLLSKRQYVGTLISDSGNGKTHLLKAAYNTKSEFIRCTYRSFLNNEVTELESLAHPEYLFLDNIEKLNDEARATLLAGLIERRLTDRKVTCFAISGSVDSLTNIPEKLRTRLTWGPVIGMGRPTADSLTELFNRIATAFKLELSTDVRAGIVDRLRHSSYREAVSRVLTLCTIAMSNPADRSLSSAVDTIFPKGSPVLSTPDRIISAIELYYGVTRVDLASKVRTRSVTTPRHIAMYLVKTMCPHLTLQEIGSYFGARDHSTVLHGVTVIKTKLLTDVKLKTAVTHLENRVELKGL